MFKSLLAPAVAGLLACGVTLTALAAESTVEMTALRAKGPGPVIGTIMITETSDGTVLQFNLTEIPPGPNRLYLHEEGDCALIRAEALTTSLATINVSTNDDGALPLRTTVLVRDLTLADLSGKALVVHRGAQIASLTPEQVGAPRLVACGVIQP